MAEQWIAASKTVLLGFEPRALCVRLHKGLLEAKADSIHCGNESQEGALLPKWFWWAEGHEALEQDWQTGDFSTWIDQKHYWQAFGVRFPLSGLLELLPFEQRSSISRSLSVASNSDWMSARGASNVVGLSIPPLRVADHLIAQASHGFVAARAVSADGYLAKSGGHVDLWHEREWDVPADFWASLAGPSKRKVDFTLGNFEIATEQGTARGQTRLEGVHFLASDIAAIAGPVSAQAPVSNPVTRGPKPKYDWLAATNAVWADIFEGGLIPKSQAEVEVAMIRVLTKGDMEPGESTVRPYASAIWQLFSREADNSA